MLGRIEAMARARDPRVRQVMASVAAEHDIVLVVRGDGLIAADVRPLVRVSVSVPAAPSWPLAGPLETSRFSPSCHDVEKVVSALPTGVLIASDALEVRSANRAALALVSVSRAMPPSPANGKLRPPPMI